jgi:PadR family transcriptional regulator AphA
MPKVNKTKYAILGVLSIKPGSGYDIKKFCDQSIAHFWHENFGHIYPVLKQMEEKGLITKKIERTEGKPDRNIYQITPAGKTELHDWLLLPVESAPMRSEFLLKLAFGANVPKEIIIVNIKKAKERMTARLEDTYKLSRLLPTKKKPGKRPDILIGWLRCVTVFAVSGVPSNGVKRLSRVYNRINLDRDERCVGKNHLNGT